ncbi:hypothetical protein V865_001883 [Kwoniella europaea PYCC6329]|uniref:Uncharacterized protein n=1 Tax=Kwoniella europaea PYCC6329 TaxID=1423913 RepID=A0AAX4KBN9_9TREE
MSKVIHHKPDKPKDRTFTPQDSKQCMSCGKCWPWVTFDVEIVHHTSNVCTRCAAPDIEAMRWKELGQQMQKDLLKARQKLSDHRKAIAPSQHRQSAIIQPQRQPQPQPEIRRAVSGEVRQKFLSDEQLAAIRSNLPVLRSIKEPQRAILWIELTFRPQSVVPPRAPSSISQLTIYQAYKAFFDTLSSHPDSHLYPTDTPLMDGSQLIKLIIKLYQELGVRMIGNPHYSIEGLEWRPLDRSRTIQAQPQIQSGMGYNAEVSQVPFMQHQNHQQHQYQHNGQLYQLPPPQPQMQHNNAPGPTQIFAQPPPHLIHQHQPQYPPVLPQTINPPLPQPYPVSHPTHDRPQAPPQLNPPTIPSAKTVISTSIPENQANNSVNSDKNSKIDSKDVMMEVDDDDWTVFSFKPLAERSKKDIISQSLSKDRKINTELSVQPRHSQSKSSQFRKDTKTKNDQEEEIDELDDDDDDDDDINMNVKLENGRDRVGSEDEVGDMLI